MFPALPRLFGVLALVVLASAGLGTCGRAGSFEPIGTGVLDGGIPGCDGGRRSWCLRMREAFALEQPYMGGRPTALGSHGAVAGTLMRDPNSPFAWVVNADGTGLTLWDQLLPMAPAFLRALHPGGISCGNSYWLDPQQGVYLSTAIIGTDAGFSRLLPDPLLGECSDMNLSGTTIGSWDQQGFLRWSDGGVFRFDLFRNPASDGGRFPFLVIDVKALNERNEVAGNLRGGHFFERGYSTGLYWSPDSGPVFLRNEVTQPLAGMTVNDINNLGVIVGQGHDYYGQPRACTWPDPYSRPTFFTDPWGRFTQTEAHSINDKGLIVGTALDQTLSVPSGFHSFGIMWWKGKAYLLNDLVAAQTDLHVESLYLVNNQDRIAGTARKLIYGPDGGDERSARYPIIIDVLRYP